MPALWELERGRRQLRLPRGSWASGPNAAGPAWGCGVAPGMVRGKVQAESAFCSWSAPLHRALPVFAAWLRKPGRAGEVPVAPLRAKWGPSLLCLRARAVLASPLVTGGKEHEEMRKSWQKVELGAGAHQLPSACLPAAAPAPQSRGGALPPQSNSWDGKVLVVVL